MRATMAAAAAAALAGLGGGAAAEQDRWYSGLRAPAGVANFHDRSSSVGDESTCALNQCNGEIAGGPRFVFIGYEPAESGWRFDLTGEFIFRTDVEDLLFARPGGGAPLLFDVNIRNVTSVAHAYYDWPLSERWSVYAGLGAGVTYYQAESRDGPGDTAGVNPVGRLGFGATWAFAENWSLELGASATALGGYDIESPVTAPGVTAEIGQIALYEVLAGVRYYW